MLIIPSKSRSTFAKLISIIRNILILIMWVYTRMSTWLQQVLKMVSCFWTWSWVPLMIRKGLLYSRRRQLIVCVYIIGKWHPYFLQFKSLSCHRIYFAGQIFSNYLDDVRRSLSFMHAKKECVTILSLLVIARLILDRIIHDLNK